MRKALTVAAATAATLIAVAPAAVAEDAPTAPSPAPTETVTPLERVSAYTQPSIVYIGISWKGYVWDKYNRMYLNNGQPFSLKFQCTGYVVNPDGYIATAGHCVDPAEVVPVIQQAAAQWALENGYYAATDLTLEQVLGFGDYVVQNSEGKRGPERHVTTAWSQSAGGVETGKALPARVVKWQKFDQGDGAMLKVEAENLNALPLADDDISIGTEVVAIGYPGSVDMVADPTFTPSYKEGAVSSTKTVSNGLLKVYEISAAVSGGMSGGPTVNLEGEVVGFNSFGINSQIETQPFNFVRPVETVQELLGDAGTQGELSDDAASYREGLDAFFAGDKATAVAELGAVVDSQPTNEMAKKYLDKAKQLPDPPKRVEDEGSSLGLILGIAGGAAALLVAALGTVLALSRRKRRGSAGMGPVAAPSPSSSAGVSSTPNVTSTPNVSSTPVGAGVAGPPAPVPAGFHPPASMHATEPAGASASLGGPSASVAGVSAAVVLDGPESAVAEGSTDDTLYCAHCGTRGAPGQRFCKHCGTAL